MNTIDCEKPDLILEPLQGVHHLHCFVRLVRLSKWTNHLREKELRSLSVSLLQKVPRSTMTAVVGRAWGWLRSWARSAASDKTRSDQDELNKRTGSGWKEHNCPGDDEYWEAQEKPMEIEEVRAGKQEMEPTVEPVARWWWNTFLPKSFLPRGRKTQPSGLKPNLRHIKSGERDIDGDFSDYGTPPPSPTPRSRLASPFRLFVRSWNVELFPEHYEICFNFLRHLFDLFVVGFLWIVSPPVKLILEILGIQGPLRLWLHGMAMFFVSTVGMAGLLWLIQEHLPEFAFIYGIVQALVISVSLKNSVLFGLEDEQPRVEEESMEAEMSDGEQKELLCASDKKKTS
ncbi:uncharacterized protein C6orf47 homolog [Syngnathus scovelli]|uniref:uncharacterized protein C6orf47 homolog n=1 Tax=Syngnathus scovelli TaxID=161590 RepID=UPI0021107C4D|nr:uncharacterized protein C6orf47 homolog [Syngnathus scovelli]